MIVRKMMPLAAWAGCWLANPAAAQTLPATPTTAQHSPAAPGMSNQQLANAVKVALEYSGQLRGQSVGVVCRAGKVDLTGSVASDAQREAILQTVCSVPGVQAVHESLMVTGHQTGVVRVQAIGGPPATLPTLPTATQPPAMAPMAGRPPMMAGPVPGMPVTDPVPMASGPGPTPYDMNPPRLPTYAWPTYAPYNNFGRVAYPTAYPYNAWPFIGPFYPFPKVPPGWRKVSLEWDDGHWYMGRAGTGYDRWVIRYW